MKKVLYFMVIIFSLATSVYGIGYEKEREISRDVNTFLEANSYILHDSEASWIVQNLADQLQSNINSPVYNMRVQIVKDPSINAFAITDGHIYVNIGTLLFVKDIYELAAVLAHEMGHCQLRHIPQSMDSQTRLTAAAVIGAILGAIVTAVNPPIGSAILMSSLGGAQNITLAYTRRHETEADAFAVKLLKDSGMDPAAMARFLIRLRVYYSDDSSVPQYMLTHPYTQDRIAVLGNAPGDPEPDSRFYLLYSTVLGSTMKVDQIKNRSAGMPEMYLNYAIGASLARSGKYKESLKSLNSIELPQARGWIGINYYNLGDKQKAFSYLKSDSRNPVAANALADIYMQKGEYNEAISILQPFSMQSPRASYTLGTLYEKQGKPGLSHIAYARYFFSMQNYTASLHHIKRALQDSSLDELSKAQLKDMSDTITKITKS